VSTPASALPGAAGTTTGGPPAHGPRSASTPGGSARPTSLGRRLSDRLGGQALVLAALALLGVATVLPPLALPRPTYELMVTFDITQSMDVEDMRLDGQPASRLAFARAAMRETLRELPCGSKVGWAVFTNYRTMPLIVPVEVCSHYEELLASLDKIDGRMRWSNASNVGKAVAWVLRTARDIPSKPNVVFITDGHESPPLRGEALPPLGDLEPGAIDGWVVGVGGAVPAPIPKTDREGRTAGVWAAGDVVQGQGEQAGLEHLSALREPHLQALARGTGLGYLKLDATDALGDALQARRLARVQPVETDLRWLPALAALALLVLRFAPWPRWRRRPQA
jgi:mxaL protein